MLLAASILASCSSSVTRKFVSEDGKFSVTAPVLLEEKPQTIDVNYGKVDAHTFIAEKEGIAYVVAYTDFQDEVIQKSDQTQLLNAARDSMIGSVEGKLALETVVSLGETLGREVVIQYTRPDNTSATLKARVFMVKSRLYQVMTLAEKGAESDPAITAFFDSFRLTGVP